MITSFRLRLALLSALLSGLVLAAFGVGSLWFIRNAEKKKIDVEIRVLLLKQLPLSRDAEVWRASEPKLRLALGIQDERMAAIRIQSVRDGTLFQSSGWPIDLKLPEGSANFSQDKPAAEVARFSMFSVAHAADWPSAPTVQLAQGGPPRGGPPPGGPRGFPPPQGMPQSVPETGAADRSGGASTTPVTSSLESVSAPPLASSPGSGGSPNSDALTPPEAANTVNSLSTPSTVAPQTESHRRFAPPLSSLPPIFSDVRVVSARSGSWIVGVTDDPSLQLAIAVDAAIVDERTRDTRNAFLFLMPISLLLIGAGSWALAGRAMRPLSRLTDMARRVTAEGLGKRISSEGNDQEFAKLIEVFNKMLQRLDRSFKQAQRFSADAAHEIRTPLAIVQGQLERAIRQAPEGSTMQINLSSILDEVRRLSTISSKLLLLAKADAGKLAVFNEDFDLSKALEDLIEDARMLAPNLQIHGNVHQGLAISGDASLLRQLLHNLLSNAIKYNAPDSTGTGWIQIKTSQWSSRVEVLVANSSAGIPATQQEMIFERFFRGDTAHTRTVEGLGLGLSVSREIARAHGGELNLHKEAKDGVQFSLLLPTGSKPPLALAKASARALKTNSDAGV